MFHLLNSLGIISAYCFLVFGAANVTLDLDHMTVSSTFITTTSQHSSPSSESTFSVSEREKELLNITGKEKICSSVNISTSQTESERRQECKFTGSVLDRLVLFLQHEFQEIDCSQMQQVSQSSKNLYCSVKQHLHHCAGTDGVLHLSRNQSEFLDFGSVLKTVHVLCAVNKNAWIEKLQ
ncbi:uncharacterized protein LOC101853710 isoform X2 [Aplysia californica]|uniref:Uncharacterized protein LOC101853710 isoform X2 n=1 Tax=Aplysia californica TaxID=6500 RepID=A0ABM1VWM9_APLCA|nr:uncharacterized protein LOC101853710 isoform X2 [Aplysia californica]